MSWSRIETISKGYKSLDFGNGRFVAGGPKGAVAISADGIVWDFPRFPIIEDFVGNGASFTARHASANQITFYDGRFYALARQNGWGNVMVVSDDGLDWERVTEGNGLIDFRLAQTRRLQVADESLYLLGSSGELWKTLNWEQTRERILPYFPWDWEGVAASDSRVVLAGEGGNYGWSDDGEVFHFG